MKDIIRIVSLLFCFLITPSVFANSTGEISFHGSVIEEYNCQPIQTNHQIQLDCSTNNNTLSESEIVFHSQLEYLNQDKKLAVMNITYH